MRTIIDRIVDRLFGPVEDTYTDVPGGSAIRTVRLPEADYLVSLNLRQVTRGRARGRKRRCPYVVDWEAPGQGIPTEGPLRGRIGGAEVVVSQLSVMAGTWPSEATAEIAVQIARYRTSEGWEPTSRIVITDVVR